MPQDLWDVLDVCPTVNTWKTRGRPPEPTSPDFATALCSSSNLSAPSADRRSPPSTLATSLCTPAAWSSRFPGPRPTQHGDQVELVVLPRGNSAGRYPVTVLEDWIHTADITDGPVLRPVSKGNRPLPRRFTAGAVNDCRLPGSLGPPRPGFCHLGHGTTAPASWWTTRRVLTSACGGCSFDLLVLFKGMDVADDGVPGGRCG